MSEEMQRFQKRQHMETTVIKLSTFTALLCSAWVLYHSVTLALSGLAWLVPYASRAVDFPVQPQGSSNRIIFSFLSIFFWRNPGG